MIPLSDTDLYRRRVPFVNLTLIALNALVFLYDLTLGGDGATFVYTYGLIPDELVTGNEFQVLVTRTGNVDITTPVPTWATLFTSMFMHGGLVHFGSNMVYLWVFGDNLESRMGHFIYLGFYVTAGLAAAGMQIAVDLHSQVPIIGASGAIAGVLGAYVMLFPHSQIRTLLIYFIITVVRIPAVYLLGFWFLLQFWGGLGTLGPSTPGGGVAYWAHIGGFAVGVAAVALYRIARRQPLWSRNPSLWE